MKIISSKMNLNIKNLSKLNNSRKERSIQKLFIIEGLKIIKEAIINNIELQDIFLTKKFLDEKEYELKHLLPNNAKMSIINFELLNKISCTQTPQEIIAVCKIPNHINIDDLIFSSNNLLLISQLQDPGNLGTIIRTSNALGIDGIILSKDCPDIYSSKVLRSTMGCMFGFNIVVSEYISEIIEKCKNNKFKVYASSLSDTAIDITKVIFTKKNLIIVGNEGKGISQEIINICDIQIKIPMIKNMDSLNVSIATGILLWELKKGVLKLK